MQAYGLTQLINEPTHKNEHTLDQIYINQNQMELVCEVIPGTLDISTDHYPIIFKLPCVQTQSQHRNAIVRKLKNIDTVTFRSELSEIMDNINTQCNFSSMYGEYKVLTENLVNKHAPLITKRMHNNSRPCWMDYEFIQSRTKRCMLEKVWRKQKSEINRKNYVDQRNLCAQLAIDKQQSYYSKLVEKSSHSQNSLFKIVDELLDKKSERILPTQRIQ